MTQAIKSVLGQTYPNLELIVIDDASSDGTWAAIQSVSDPRLRVLRHDINQGSHTTLNTCLAMARGEYLAILNSDDVFMPKRIESCLGLLASDQADLVGTDIRLLDQAGNRLNTHWWLDAFSALKAVHNSQGDWVATLLAGNVFMTTSNFVFGRTWLEQVGAFGDWRYVPDYEWLLRGCARGCRLAWLDTPLLEYRLHEGNTISESPLKANQECAALLRQYLPVLAGDSALSQVRLQALVSQWARIEKYIVEIEDALRHHALVSKETELFALIRERDAWVAERDAWIEQRDGAIRELEAAVRGRDGWVADRDSWIAERDVWIEQRDRVVRELEVAVRDRDSWVADRDSWIAERDAVIADLDVRLSVCEVQNTRLMRSRAYRLGRLITAPARWLQALLTGVSTKT
ncbi:MAG: glycosyltransferase [Hydrogenophilales bacterium]|nr:glycosyltransferase [Hydrogenophilales bacterium]